MPTAAYVERVPIPGVGPFIDAPVIAVVAHANVSKTETSPLEPFYDEVAELTDGGQFVGMPVSDSHKSGVVGEVCESNFDRETGKWTLLCKLYDTPEGRRVHGFVQSREYMGGSLQHHSSKREYQHLALCK
jgi:hypothetical protein